MRINLYVNRLLIAITTIITTAPAFASDGQLEINQACAVNTGCFTGDTPGFPVTIIQPGSYRLTGNLDLSAEGVNVSGVVVSVPAVTVDLGGFHIAGPTTCSSSGATISCSPTTSKGTDLAGIQFTNNAAAAVVQNGIVRNMANYGIVSRATGLRVRDITAIHNANDGINSFKSALVVNSIAIENGQDGIDLNAGSVVDGVTAIGNGKDGVQFAGLGSMVTRTAAQENGRRGFSLTFYSKFGNDNLSHGNAEADSCGGGICTERRRMYLTQTDHATTTVLTACALGFHTASFGEIHASDRYDYDPVLGRTNDDSGQGTPQYGAFAWARSGRPTGATSNCFVWTSTNPGATGTEYLLDLVPAFHDPNPGAVPSTPRVMFRLATCDRTAPVWCIEDN